MQQATHTCVYVLCVELQERLSAYEEVMQKKAEMAQEAQRPLYTNPDAPPRMNGRPDSETSSSHHGDEWSGHVVPINDIGEYPVR